MASETANLDTYIAEFEDAARKSAGWAVQQSEEGHADFAAKSRATARRARTIADALKNAKRYAALRPMLSVGETEDGEWGLWCVSPRKLHLENIPAIYYRGPTEEEECAGADGDASWGPSVEAMLDELVDALPSGGAS